MLATAIKTHKIQVGESLTAILDLYLPPLEEEDIIVITSKVVSLCEGRVISKSSVRKDVLIYEEADAIASTPHRPYDVYLTIKNNLIIPSAGIDESNSQDNYILYPKNVQETACHVWEHIQKKHHLKHFGVMITDSHTTPLRRGVTGVALGWYGFNPLYSYVDKPDIYGHPLKFTYLNLIDALASTATLVMGEGDEQTPLAYLKNVPKIDFYTQPSLQKSQEIVSVSIPLEDDLYAPLLTCVPWETKK